MSIDTTKIVRNIKIGDKYMPVPTPAGANTFNAYLNKSLVEIKKEDFQGTDRARIGFSKFPNLQKIVIPNNIKFLENHQTFIVNCPSLKTLTFEEPSTLMSIYLNSETDEIIGYGTVLIKTLILPDTMNATRCKIGGESLEYVSIGSQLTKLSSQFLYDTGKKTYTNNKNFVLIDRAITPPTWSGDLGYYAEAQKQYISIYVPDASVDTYKAASGWSKWADRIFPLSTAPAEPADEI